MLTNREAALLYGQGWECADTGADVWQKLTIHLGVSQPLPSEDAALNKASRLLRRRRLEVHFGLEQLEGQVASLSSFPLARLAARKKFVDLETRVVHQKELLEALPQRTRVHRLDPEAVAEGVPAGALKIGSAVWYVDKKSQQVFSCAITHATIEQIDGQPTLVYQTAGVEQGGKPLRRSCAHVATGLRTLNAPESAFMDPLTARDFLKMIAPPPTPVADPLPVAAKPAVVDGHGPAPMPKIATVARPAHVLRDRELHDAATAPFDESMLKD